MTHKVGESEHKPIKQWFLDLAEVINAFRLVPRIMCGLVGYLAWDVFQWYMLLPDPNMSHAIMITGVSGLVTGIAGLYFNTPKK